MSEAIHWIIEDHFGPRTRTKKDRAEVLYCDITYDLALPQSWVDDNASTYGDDIASHFVWLYPEGNPFGFPGPVTGKGLEILCKMGGRA